MCVRESLYIRPRADVFRQQGHNCVAGVVWCGFFTYYYCTLYHSTNLTCLLIGEFQVGSIWHGAQLNPLQVLFDWQGKMVLRDDQSHKIAPLDQHRHKDLERAHFGSFWLLVTRFGESSFGDFPFGNLCVPSRRGQGWSGGGSLSSLQGDID